MAQPSAPFGKLFAATMVFAAPGLVVLAGLGVLGIITPPWALLGSAVCIIIAAFIATPLIRDLVRLANYGDELSRNATPPEPVLSGWDDSAELAARFRRIAREWRRNAQNLKGNAVSRQTVFDHLPQPLLLLGRDRKILRANHAALGLTGTDPAGGDLAGAIRDPAVLELADLVLAGGNARQTNFSIPGDVERYFSVHIVPLGDDASENAAALVVLYDLTERQKVEHQRADFIANVSHELQTPLASLVGFIETLRGPARDDGAAREKFLGLMDSQAGRMARLVRDLLSLSAIEMDEHTRPRGKVAIGDIITAVTESLALEARSRDMALVCDVAQNLPAVAGDRDQITQLVENLVDNAIKYGDAGSKVLITARFEHNPEPGMVSIAVTDAGAGIAPEYIPRLTERFYRADAARSRTAGGTGLGLAIVKHIVTRHRGRFDIASTLGKGSTFSVSLPVAGK